MKTAQSTFGLFAMSASLLLAQGGAPFAESQKANAQALRQYTWKSRTELKLKGESKSVKLEQVRYDLNGKLQKTPIGAPPRPHRRRSSRADAAAGSRRRSSRTRRKSSAR